MAKPLPSAEVLRRLFEYDPKTGSLTHKVRDESEFGSRRVQRLWNTQNAGKVAGYVNSNGYRMVRIFGTRYFAHRAIWKLNFGYEPEVIDHIDGNSENNRLANLRSCSFVDNTKNKAMPSNNTSGCIGVHWCRTRKKWLSYIRVGDKHKFLGYYSEFDDAVASRHAGEKKYGFHKNHGRHKYSQAAYEPFGSEDRAGAEIELVTVQ